MKSNIPIVAIIGRPNVGKSTLFNRLIGKKIAITTDVPGTTRDRLYERVSWGEKEFFLIDTAGIELKFDEKFAEDIEAHIEASIKDADLIVFMTDVTSGLNNQDRKAIKTLRKSKKDSILAVNKVDNQAREASLPEFYKLGLGEPTPISAISGKGTGDLLDKIVERLKDIKTKTLVPKDTNDKDKEDIIKVSLIGRPNVGKSSLFNALVNEKRAIVSEVPGTTRDVVITQFDYKDKKIDFIDTAGLRRRGKIGQLIPGSKKEEGKIEKYSSLRSIRAMDQSDVVILVIDGVEGVVAQDLHLAGFAKDAGKGVILAINKMDIADEITVENYLHVLRRKFKFLPFAPAIFVSAETKNNVSKILDLILEAKESRQVSIPTAKLNRFLERAVMDRPPSGLDKTSPKIKYITQKEINPPTFLIFTSHADKIHNSYVRYMENQLRKEFDFNNTAIKIEFREK